LSESELCEDELSYEELTHNNMFDDVTHDLVDYTT